MIKKLFGMVKGCLVLIGLLAVLGLVFSNGSKSSSKDEDAGKTEAVQEQVEAQPEEAEEEKSDESKKEKKETKNEKKDKETAAESKSDDKSTEGSKRPETEISEEFRAAMDSYEAFFDEYVDYMKRCNENPSDMALLAEMSDMLEREAEVLEEFEAWEQEDMTTAETAYYLEVQSRITAKLAEAM